MEEQKRERHTRRHPVRAFFRGMYTDCLLYTSDAADEL